PIGLTSILFDMHFDCRLWIFIQPLFPCLIIFNTSKGDDQHMKQRTKSAKLQKLEALIPRLSPQFPHLSALEHELAKEMKGYIGEKKVDYHIGQLSGTYTIL